MYNYLRIKQASDDSKAAFDPSKYLSGKDLEAYNKYKPIALGSETLPDGYTTSITTVPYSGAPGGPDDPKSRHFVERYYGDVVSEGKPTGKTRYYYRDSVLEPMQNLRYGDAVDKYSGNVASALHDLGYGGADLAGVSYGKTMGLEGLYDSEGKYVGKDKPTATIYVDENGNPVKRSRGVVYGRRTGRILGGTAGGLGGYYGGNLLADKLGLNAEDADGYRRALGTMLRLGGAGLGVYGGGWAGSRLGSSIGNYFDPQQGKQLRVRAVNK